jgi:DNA-binding FadR family transcriptional regulator
VWHQAAEEGNLESLETLWIWSKEVEINTDELLLAKTGKEYTAFYLAAKNNHVETLKKMWVWAEEMQINPKELKKKLFLATDVYG